MELRALTVLDSLQPQLDRLSADRVRRASCRSRRRRPLFIEIAPGIAINQLTDAALKATTCRPGHADRRARVRHARAARRATRARSRRRSTRSSGSMGVAREDRHQAADRLVADHHWHRRPPVGQLINRMRHGDMIVRRPDAVHPRGLPGGVRRARRERGREGRADIHLLEVITFGAFGRLWLGGWEAEIEAAPRPPRPRSRRSPAASEAARLGRLAVRQGAHAGRLLQSPMTTTLPATLRAPFSAGGASAIDAQLAKRLLGARARGRRRLRRPLLRVPRRRADYVLEDEQVTDASAAASRSASACA